MKKGQWFMSKINTCMFGIIPPNHINNNAEMIHLKKHGAKLEDYFNKSSVSFFLLAIIPPWTNISEYPLTTKVLCAKMVHWF